MAAGDAKFPGEATCAGPRGKVNDAICTLIAEPLDFEEFIRVTTNLELPRSFHRLLEKAENFLGE